MASEAVGLDFLLRGGGNLGNGTINAVSKQTKGPETAKTLDAYHNTQIAKMREERGRLDELKAELKQKQAELEKVDAEFSGPSLISNASDIAVLTSRQRLETGIIQLENKISKLESGELETDYFLRVGDILFSYSDAQDRIASGERPIESTAKKGRIPANSVYSYFSSNTEEEPAHNHIITNTVFSAASVTVTRASEIKNDLGFKRDKALEAYMSALDPDNIQHENSLASSIAEDYGSCPVCDTEMLFNETFLDCPGCGYRDCILVDSEKPSYKDPPREMSYYAYKKINHLNEWLAQFQAKETTEISPAVLDMIRAELKKERITDMSKLKPAKLKEVIKKLKLNRCYDHVAHVLNRLNGISAPVLSREVEEKLRFMFKEIQFSFVKHCPKKRSNFLSYSFVLYKFCQLLELDDYLPCFPLLKSREKLYMQDKIWQKICEDMLWEFIRTV
jgi:Zn finger protein HypA/HybF involved in hydrogenase expression